MPTSRAYSIIILSNYHVAVQKICRVSISEFGRCVRLLFLRDSRQPVCNRILVLPSGFSDGISARFGWPPSTTTLPGLVRDAEQYIRARRFKSPYKLYLYRVILIFFFINITDRRKVSSKIDFCGFFFFVFQSSLHIHPYRNFYLQTMSYLTIRFRIQKVRFKFKSFRIDSVRLSSCGVNGATWNR